MVAEVYREEGKSGKNTDRPEYRRMTQDIKQGKLNAVLCTKIDRIRRSLVDFYRLHELLEKHNTSAHNGADECSLKRVGAQALEDLIAERLKMMARNRAFVNQIMEELDLCAKGEMAIIEEQREIQKRALSPIVQEITNIVRFIAQSRVSDALARELEPLEVQKAQIEGEMERIDLEAREIANRTLNARAIQEGLGLFEEIWENATPEERKELMRFFVYKVIFTPAEVKMGLYSRPIFAGQVESTATGNHTGVGAVDRMNWLPGQDSNLQPSG